MSSSSFEPARLRLARELSGLSQLDLARRVELTAAALSQFESGATRPSPSTQSRLAEQLGVPERFLQLPVFEVHEGFFRSLRRTAVAERRRARAIAHIAHDVATAESLGTAWPVLRVPSKPVSLDQDNETIEWIAADVRKSLGLARGPAPNIVHLLETHGVVVIRLPLGSADVDAFSLPFPDHPVVVLGANKNDRARSRFDGCHELGHLVMHGEAVWGIAEVEKQAHSFAAAFLMPRDDIASELPERPDWPQLFQLKRRWQVSIAALLMRAKALGRMSEGNYLTAMKAISLHGWRRVEPVPLGKPEQPELFAQRIATLQQFNISSPLPYHVIRALASAAAA
jgi:Zn-dependent peptidase ImmA (M78 family)/DNA-binding XRE family transcriptional regulator